MDYHLAMLMDSQMVTLKGLDFLTLMERPKD